MKGSCFYQTQTDNAIPLLFISEQAWNDKLPDVPQKDIDYLKNQRFTAKVGELVVIKNEQGITQNVYCGVGKDNYEMAMASAASRLLPASYITESALSITVLKQWALAQYYFTTYKKREIEPVILVVAPHCLEELLIEVNAIFLVRDLINSPPNVMTPEHLANVVAEKANHYNAEFKEWVGEELLAANFPAIHMVGKSSDNTPRLISLTWGNKAHPKVTLIGKGVCFDTGGLDIKPALGMRLMKKDMGGAAHALGLAEWIMAKKLPIFLTLLIPAVENAIGPNAFRPGDIFFMRNGLSVEVDNTDAEGRLILGDALVKAGEENPELIIDFATLTGAARVALGTDIAVMFSNNEQVAADLLKVSEEVNDPIWRLPLVEKYKPMLNSTMADLLNASASPYAGAITAALFLQYFVPATTPWVHFDIMAWNLMSTPGKPEGGEALAISAVAHYLQQTYYQGK